MNSQIIGHKYQLVFQTPNFDITQCFSTDGSRQKIDGEGFIRACVDFYDHRRALLPNKNSTNLQLHEMSGESVKPHMQSSFVPGQDTTYIPNMNKYQDLREEIGEILGDKFPEHFMHGEVVIFTDFSGFNIFNNKYDKGKTLGPHLLRWARDLEVGRFLSSPEAKA